MCGSVSRTMGMLCPWKSTAVWPVTMEKRVALGGSGEVREDQTAFLTYWPRAPSAMTTDSISMERPLMRSLRRPS